MVKKIGSAWVWERSLRGQGARPDFPSDPLCLLVKKRPYIHKLWPAAPFLKLAGPFLGHGGGVGAGKWGRCWKSAPSRCHILLSVSPGEATKWRVTVRIMTPTTFYWNHLCAGYLKFLFLTSSSPKAATQILLSSIYRQRNWGPKGETMSSWSLCRAGTEARLA